MANVSDLREAGHDFADTLFEIADGIDPGIGKTIKPRIERIHGKLRNGPLPVESGLFATDADRNGSLPRSFAGSAASAPQGFLL